MTTGGNDRGRSPPKRPMHGFFHSIKRSYDLFAGDAFLGASQIEHCEARVFACGWLLADRKPVTAANTDFRRSIESGLAMPLQGGRASGWTPSREGAAVAWCRGEPLQD